MRIAFRRAFALLLCSSILGPTAVAAQSAPHTLRAAHLFGDGMVMQRDVEVPVWGWATPGERVTVTFDGTARVATADAAGGWRVLLPAMSAGGPHVMRIAGAQGPAIDVRDILVGDVWIASGQSNMEWTVSVARDAEREIASANDLQIRHFKVPNSYAFTPEEDLAGGSWAKAVPQQVGDFSAVAYFFARDLRRSVDVPIGIVNNAWGGSRVEPWMSREALALDSAAWAAIERDERDYQRRKVETLRARLGALPASDSGLVNGRALWADPSLDDASWLSIAVPSTWEQQGWDGMDGVAWYRTSFELTADEARRGVRLGLGMIDDSDASWVNGVEVGRTMNAWNRARTYDVPASALRAGRNVIAVRVEDTGGGGGIAGDSSSLWVEVGGMRRSLAARWRFRPAVIATAPDGQHINKVPTLLFNAMVHPIVGYPIKGVLWYQGESNADRYEDAVEYASLFRGLITSWRGEWGHDFPFLWVSLANFMEPGLQARSAWATLRESQHAALALPHTGEAMAIDIGETDDIHPRNKQDVGARLALVARKVAYGDTNVVSSGPTMRAHRVEDGRVVLEFDDVGSGLMTKPGTKTLGGFMIAGAEGRWLPADARIEGDRVIVWNASVRSPVAVRYAWGNNPIGANLYNREGLPASPFRTDRW